MFLRIEKTEPKKLVGVHATMSVSTDKTVSLWQYLMPRRHLIRHKTNEWLYSMQIYDPENTFENMTIDTLFDKWAALEVNEWENIPEGMSTHLLTGGLYAVFLYKGKPAGFPALMKYIYTDWMPQSGYTPEHREHFEMLGEKYKRDHDDSEEEVWIPIKPA